MPTALLDLRLQFGDACRIADVALDSGGAAADSRYPLQRFIGLGAVGYNDLRSLLRQAQGGSLPDA